MSSRAYGDCKVADTFVFFIIMKLYKTNLLAKKEITGNVLSIMLTPLKKKATFSPDFLILTMTLASDHGGRTPTHDVRHVYFE